MHGQDVSDDQVEQAGEEVFDALRGIAGRYGLCPYCLLFSLAFLARDALEDGVFQHGPLDPLH
jgi:hypothetical protein